MKNIMYSNIKKVLKKLIMLNEYEKNVLIIFNMHINQATELIIKNFIDLIIKKIVESKHEVTVISINKTYD